MKLGDEVLFYHSSTEPNAIVGTAAVVREAYPDHTAFDSKSDHYDPKSTTANPTWFMVDVQLTRTFERPLTLSELRGAKQLAKMELLRQGSRLSVQPVTEKEWQAVLDLAERAPDYAGDARGAPKKVSRKGAKTRRRATQS
jgi:predicted RNA-binding protein with PUA-like domain